ncbi:MAG TPA: YggT family protein [Gemmatimonadales bacterium]|nr:YggT family protein [Gemmatimonadales bacterium]
MNLVAELIVLLIEAARILIGVAFVAVLLVALTHWLVREGKIAAFGGWAGAVRKVSDPLLRPIEQRLVAAGGNPQHAPWWLLGGVVVGGLLLISLLKWLLGFVVSLSFAVSGGPRALTAMLVNAVFSVLMLALLIRVIASWFGAGRYNRFVRITYTLTDWLVEPLRRVLPPFGMLDLSPLAAYLLLMVARGVVVGAIL